MKHFNIRISGKVQGVWFRESTRRKAQSIRLAGFVKNLPDGTVYVEVEGPENALQVFVLWCHHGPELANVSRVDVAEAPLVGFSQFEVLR